VLRAEQQQRRNRAALKDVLSSWAQGCLVVKNPEPLEAFYVRSMWGNGTSNIAHLIVNYKY
jgi:hypothetical protein